MSTEQRQPLEKLLVQAARDAQDFWVDGRRDPRYFRRSYRWIARDQARGNDVSHPEDIDIYANEFLRVYGEEKRLKRGL